MDSFEREKPFWGTGFEADIIRADGSKRKVSVGPEDMITNDEGDVVGIAYEDAQGGDELKNLDMILSKD